METNKTLTTHQGGCHCGTVRFEVTLDLSQGGTRCNCSICNKLALTMVSVKPEAFRLLAGEGQTGTYVWGSGIGTRHFCLRCGIHCFGPGDLPELGGKYVSVSLNALDDVDVNDLQVMFWDGRHDNWHAGMRATPWPIFARAA
jgi:hypothetical protein